LLSLLLCASAEAADDKEIRAGKRVYKKQCAQCHFTLPDKDHFGPSLFGIVGRKAASVPRFPYSPALRKSGIVWTEEKLDEFVTNPRQAVKGVQMIYAGLKNPEQRKALITFLKSLK
jgi:cytochrome c